MIWKGQTRMPMDDRSLDKRFQAKKDQERRIKAGMPGEDEASLPPPVEPIRAGQAVGRNDPCPCGSGKKHKKCCGK
jgi:preprotein translocase subunit SecA